MDRKLTNLFVRKSEGTAGDGPGPAANRDADAEDPVGDPRPRRFVTATGIPILIALALVVLATVALFVVRDALATLNLVSIVYLVPVVVAATRWGIVPALVAAFSGAAAADFFFYPPLYSFEIGDAQNLADLLVYVVIAFVTGYHTGRIRSERDNLRRSRKEIRNLYAFSRQLAACFTVSDLIAATEKYLSETLGHRAFLIAGVDIDRELPTGAIPEAARRAASAMLATGEHRSRTIAVDHTSDSWLVCGVSVGTAAYAALVNLGSGTPDDLAAVVKRVDAAIGEAATTLARLDVAKAIEAAELKLQADALKDALIGSVSNELRTPLASILGSTSVLDQMPAVKTDSRVRALVEAVHVEASRLDTNIQNLLNAARITARGVEPHLEWTDPTDIVNAAVKQKGGRLAAHRLDIAIAADLPLVRVNSVLVEQALGQLLENAAKYSPADATIRISANFDQQHVVLAVADQGSGLSSEERRRLGERSFHGSYLDRVPGPGLGLWIATTFVTANGGTLAAESPGPGLGTTISIRLPAGMTDTSERAEAM
jgi:K+-sensing histidine kinase KdpD